MFILMDVEYTWILWQGKNCRQFRLLFPLSFIGQIVYPVYSLLDVITYITYRVAPFFSSQMNFKAFPMLWVSDSRTNIQSYIDYREASLSKKIISI